MADTRIILAGLWAAVMLTYLWGDVLRIFAGDQTPGTLTQASSRPCSETRSHLPGHTVTRINATLSLICRAVSRAKTC